MELNVVWGAKKFSVVLDTDSLSLGWLRQRLFEVWDKKRRRESMMVCCAVVCLRCLRIIVLKTKKFVITFNIN
jgi:hypothetical protein